MQYNIEDCMTHYDFKQVQKNPFSESTNKVKVMKPIEECTRVDFDIDDEQLSQGSI